MEKTSLMLLFLFSLTVIAFCSYSGDAREMTKEEVNCLGGKCPEGKKNCNCLTPVAQIFDPPGVCDLDKDCTKYCPKQCKRGRTCACACNGGQCFCQC